MPDAADVIYNGVRVGHNTVRLDIAVANTVTARESLEVRLDIKVYTSSARTQHSPFSLEGSGMELARLLNHHATPDFRQGLREALR